MVNEAKLNQLIGQMLSDLGGASSVAMVRIGDALGLYKALYVKGATTAEELAAAAGVNERYLREWLANQAASNYLSYDPATRQFALPEEQEMIFAAEDSPVYMLGGFDPMAAMLDNQPKVEAAFRTRGGVAWGEQAGCMFCAVARFFRPGYHNHLLVGVQHRDRKGRALARRCPPTQRLALRRHDLDHVGPGLGHQQGRVWPLIRRAAGWRRPASAGDLPRGMRAARGRRGLGINAARF
jgi:hypothetical protein